MPRVVSHKLSFGFHLFLHHEVAARPDSIITVPPFSVYLISNMKCSQVLICAISLFQNGIKCWFFSTLNGISFFFLNHFYVCALVSNHFLSLCSPDLLGVSSLRSMIPISSLQLFRKIKHIKGRPKASLMHCSNQCYQIGRRGFPPSCAHTSRLRNVQNDEVLLNQVTCTPRLTALSAALDNLEPGLHLLPFPNLQNLLACS